MSTAGNAVLDYIESHKTTSPIEFARLRSKMS